MDDRGCCRNIAEHGSLLCATPRDPEERAKVIAQVMQANARQLTLYDREGKELTSVGPKDTL
jgi:hypothetical protein